MGLDAYVYRNRTHLAFDPGTAGVSVDGGRTGVVDFGDPDLYRRFADHVVAIPYGENIRTRWKQRRLCCCFP
jgi:hypothetical protein